MKGGASGGVVDVAEAFDLSQTVVFEPGIDRSVGDADGAELVGGILLGAVHAEDVVSPGGGEGSEEQNHRAAGKGQVRPDAILIEPEKEDQRDRKKEQEITIE